MTTGVSLEQYVDFFVHPDYHRLKGCSVTDQVERYEAELQRRIERSPLPILLYDTDPKVQQGEFWSGFPSEQRFQTIPGGGGLDPTREVHRTFNRLIEEHEVLSGVVHGSYLQYCVRAFKSNLFANRETGVLYARNPFDEHPLGELHGSDNVKYGVVLRMRNEHTPEHLQNALGADPECPPEDFADDYQIFSASISS